jgi:hypothetical protein
MTIDAKSSSNRIISAASFVTSLPVKFMEIPRKMQREVNERGCKILIDLPISPCLIAGESLTPSPVTAQTNPSA